jgi:hypothetical protein
LRQAPRRGRHGMALPMRLDGRTLVLAALSA